MKRRWLLVMFVSLLAGLAIFQWGAGLLRNYGGDVIAVLFLFSFFSLVTSWRTSTKLLTVGAIALTIEILQIFLAPSTNDVATIALGSAFDPFDLLAYAVGLGIATSIGRSSTT